VSRVVQHITDHGLSTANFVIELTESAWSVDSAEALDVVARLRAAGMWLALDNFGVGYTSLLRLRDLACDVIKVDRRMLVDVPTDPTAVKVLRAVFALAEACGAELIAEGIETEAQIAFLIEYGVTHAQGFQLAHPVPGPELTTLLKRHLVPEAPPRRVRSNGAGRS
jgi:EAL domain-containing protein (putative c-di-GMP-specific phosphodiesterase class I)